MDPHSIRRNIICTFVSLGGKRDLRALTTETLRLLVETGTMTPAQGNEAYRLTMESRGVPLETLREEVHQCW